VSNRPLWRMEQTGWSPHSMYSASPARAAWPCIIAVPHLSWLFAPHRVVSHVGLCLAAGDGERLPRQRRDGTCNVSAEQLVVCTNAAAGPRGDRHARVRGTRQRVTHPCSSWELRCAVLHQTCCARWHANTTRAQKSTCTAWNPTRFRTRTRP
jgi:hypothetical protein